jgi:oxaloacetate decarboxylase (Na+ extruding) subunit gamma
MDNLICQGLELAFFGMGTVFVFLSILIFACKAMSALLLGIAPEAAPAFADTAAQKRVFGESGLLVAIITAAIRQHRNSKK